MGQPALSAPRLLFVNLEGDCFTFSVRRFATINRFKQKDGSQWIVCSHA